MTRIISSRTPGDTEQLLDGVPPWMMNSLIKLIKDAITQSRGRSRITGESITGPHVALIHAVERQLHHNFVIDDENDEGELQDALLYYSKQGDNALDVIQALLNVGEPLAAHAYPRIFPMIDQVLVESGSKWTAVETAPSKASLEERVDEPMAAAFLESIEGSDNSSKELLKKAWAFAFGREPIPSEAYSYAIKAIEAAAWPIITPNNDSATLGHILGELRDNPQKWHSEISEKTNGFSSSSLATSMQLVWEGHTDRHGTAIPVAVSQAASEQAVFIAVMVCAYFNRGYISKS